LADDKTVAEMHADASQNDLKFSFMVNGFNFPSVVRFEKIMG